MPRRLSCSPNSFEILNSKLCKFCLLEGHLKMKVSLSPLSAMNYVGLSYYSLNFKKWKLFHNV